MRVSLQPAFLLHSRPYRDSSQLLDVFTAEHGSLSLVARGLHRRARGGSLRSLLQPFKPLLLSFSGRGELQTLTAAETAPGAVLLAGERLFSGLYLNELLLRLLHRHDPHPLLFARYGETLVELATSSRLDTLLRRFELFLIEELGYGFDLTQDAASHQPVQAGNWYRYFEGSGLVHCDSADRRLEGRYAGADLLAIAGGELEAGSVGQTAKRLLRQVLAEHLGGRVLQSREMFRQFRQGQQAGSEYPQNVPDQKESEQ